ncbi:MAG: folK [Ornithinibacter sp.]|jgi:dihydroneopterin aldolase/2-amino-4-hydroxy-6-hydroxymethyldihydropteridine diphosphokinase|nr:folK [Ornithinibacter sp.]
MARDRVRLLGVRGTGFHGVFEHERREGQEFVVDVELVVDLTPAAASDDLVDTVNYGEIGAAVLARIQGEPHDLIERVAGLVAMDVLAHAAVDEVTVTVHKPQAPVGVPLDDVAVCVTRRREPVPVVVALGANLSYRGEPPQVTLSGALACLGPEVGLTDAAASGFYDTEPVGGPEQPAYVNAVLTAMTTLSPTSLLRELHGVEARFGRTREVLWGARTLDLDLIQYGDPASGTDVTSERSSLRLPHPRAHERAFVLVPWLEVDPAATLRVGDRNRSVADLLVQLDSSGVHRHDVPPTTDGGQHT